MMLVLKREFCQKKNKTATYAKVKIIYIYFGIYNNNCVK